MGYLASCIKKIDNTAFRPMPSGKPVTNVTMAVRFSQGGTYLLTKSGTIYTNGEMSGNMCLCGTGSDHHAVKALIAFGKVTKEEALRHGKLKREQDINTERYRLVTCEIEKLTANGIVLTKRQKERIKELAGSFKPDNLPWYIDGRKAKEKIADFKKRFGIETL